MTEIANSATTTASQRLTLFSGATFHLPGVCCPPLSVQMTASFRMPISGM